ncbi:MULTISPECIES: glutamine-hydrolyzing carbamoyl-phosphate synthase small subunit [Methanosphaera]|uniref:Carbamoyl phosphate synthase small chain n=2 Tax=Methanosphaera stadtmanae TaxID=2317 RepID=Q2NF21_METST|nr:MULTISPECIES: glutamine-hydrolyzing carbamoyl-phosphate synthase small subunit [Methanosphaera]ABC57582.1 CarA [Methanosphaera stadtmanae DSM 3091]MEE0489769.1 glutamine-hydrolyzing carbamoyl-phosphate synthase small subunit [Methanosphaera stadtmanae]RAP02779.1 carbamoyl-phosphate synthase small subunit [Methanosphaera stadtmanae]RAP46704.1 MAG: carbamoyl-phosphate synthase small subunit [Methanosphaera sp. DEW79]
MVRTAKLALEDGTILTGEGFGAKTIKSGEIVFSTAMTGYVESLTDPSFKGQILMSTYPLEGNYGVSSEWYQSDDIKVEAYIVRQVCREPCHPKSEKTLSEFLEEFDVPGISNIDTRALTLKIRELGSMKAAVATVDISDEELLKIVEEQPRLEDMNLVEEITVKKPKVIQERKEYNVAVLDCGVKKSILDNLVQKDVGVVVLPSSASVQDILDLDVDGVLISSGPGNPENVDKIQDTIKQIAQKMPVAGICLGQQIIALTYGAKIYKMKFGHRGSNQPVKDLATGKIYITSQNHSFAIDEDSIEDTDLEITQINLNDGTPEAIRHKNLPISCIQYHPEAGPGPHDSKKFFDDFIETIKNY